MELVEMFQIIEPILGHELEQEQNRVIDFIDGPLWVVAGPGSGKTEVLVIRTLKLIFVDEINPKSIIVTTFTEKAAKNLFDRILNYATAIFERYPELEQQIDIHSLRIGTLHSLCNDIMIEYRYPEYENYRLLDDIEQYLFIYDHSSLIRDSPRNDEPSIYLPLWIRFDYLFRGFDPRTGYSGWTNRNYPPNRWKRTDAAILLFNRIVEDMIDIDRMRDVGNGLDLLYSAYIEYINILEAHNRCDFSHLQSKFLTFLNSEFGRLFLNGDNSERHPGISYIMVDEYQDTNPIQEAIYLKLAEGTNNLCVVGDDDQALYRFRGGTVDCMVTFDLACQRAWGTNIHVYRVFLNANHRSHNQIVDYYDTYIRSFPSMELEGARVSEKPRLVSRKIIIENYPVVGYITGRTIPITADNFADFVNGLLENNIIQRPSQCVLLMRSVRENKTNAGPFSQALRQRGIIPYNPRSRTFLEQEEIKAMLGAILCILDPTQNALNSIRNRAPGIVTMVNNWITEYRHIEQNNRELGQYVLDSVNCIGAIPRNTWLKENILEIFYRILRYSPFDNWQNDPERSYRLGKLTKLLETYAAIPYLDSPGSNRGDLKTSSTSDGEISFRWRQNFYYSLVGLLVSQGVNDPEDEGLICPPDRFPIMTVHQAKGLEFPFVFVYGLNKVPNPNEIDSSILVENELSAFRHNPPFIEFNGFEKAEHDLIRFYYVAYSRPQYALIHIVPSTHFSKPGYGFSSHNPREFARTINRLI
jgi:DNA helicase-2/ATP-dependent DNA helicase PcrA